jgi:phthiocerol/phenolphthiocerol synthesis type-I polyketide synthase E
MKGLEQRIAELPPEKRELLELLLDQRRRQAAPARQSTPTMTPPVSTTTSRNEQGRLSQPPPSRVYQPGDFSGASPRAIKAEYRTLYDTVSQQLDSSSFARHALFCNFGYVPDDSPQYAAVALPQHMINKNTTRLVLEVIGDCSLVECRVLDVGCGRGGTINVMANYFKARQLVGLDLSATAIRFCARTHRYDHASFLEGDAESLPFQNESFDVVSNLESSHSYPDIGSFYGEVQRVLKPGGFFLYTDVLSPDSWRASIERLRASGMLVERDRDITANVMRSCDETASEKLGAYDPRNDGPFMKNFLGTPDSDVYRLMKSEQWAYKIFKLRKAEAGLATA